MVQIEYHYKNVPYKAFFCGAITSYQEEKIKESLFEKMYFCPNRDGLRVDEKLVGKNFENDENLYEKLAMMGKITNINCMDEEGMNLRSINDIFNWFISNRDRWVVEINGNHYTQKEVSAIHDYEHKKIFVRSVVNVMIEMLSELFDEIENFQKIYRTEKELQPIMSDADKRFMDKYHCSFSELLGCAEIIAEEIMDDYDWEFGAKAQIFTKINGMISKIKK